jgi:hypothetical protein
MSVLSALAQVQSQSGGAHASAGVIAVRSTVRIAGLVAAALTIAVCLIALVVGLTFAAEARHWLAYPFAGIPARPAVAAMIFVHNLRALAAIGGLLLVAQSPHWAGNPAPGPIQILQRVGEALLGAVVAANLIVVGASLGAYGLRMFRAALPQGPVELAAYVLALALYLQGRRKPVPSRHVATIGALSIAALALAAVLETFVNV